MTTSLYVPTTDSVKSSAVTHHLANLIPRFAPKNYEDLKEDIRRNGVLVPIVVAEDGTIIDGRHRAQACRELGIEAPPTVVKDQADVFALILSLNVYRRHLSPEQVVAMFEDLRIKAPDLAKTIVDVEALKTKAAAAKNGNLMQGANARRGHVTPSGRTAAEVGKALGVSEKTVKRGQRAAKKAPEKLAAIAKGETTTAKVLSESKKTPAPAVPRSAWTPSSNVTRLLARLSGRQARDVTKALVSAVEHAWTRTGGKDHGLLVEILETLTKGYRNWLPATISVPRK